MATNQVIHGSNRVVENPNRYKLNAVSGQANTYDLEKVPGTITDNGTPYNKIILDKIDNVLSYLTPSVEKVESGIAWGNFVSTDVMLLQTEMSSSRLVSDPLKIYEINEITNYTSFQVRGKHLRSGETATVFIKIYYDSGTIQQTGEIKFTSTSYTNKTITFTPIDKPNITKIEFYLYSSNSSYNAYVNTITALGYTEIINVFENAFTLDNNGSFTNNQRVLIETPSLVDMTRVTSNTLNGIDIQALLQPSSKYELIYNESEDNFELGKLGDRLIIFDFTLSEATREVEVKSYFDNLKHNKTYELTICNNTTSGGTIMSAQSPITIGTGKTTDSTTSYSYGMFWMVFKYNYTNNMRNYFSGVHNYPFSQGTSNGTSCGTITFNFTTSALSILPYVTNTTFNAGTRFILREVA